MEMLRNVTSIHVPRRLVLLLSGLATLCMLGLVSHRPMAPESPPSREGVSTSPQPVIVVTSIKRPSPSNSTRGPVLRNPQPRRDVAERAYWAATVLEEQVLQETPPDSGVWLPSDLMRASDRPDSRFSAHDLALLWRVVAWVTTPTARCYQLAMMGAPRRMGSAVQPNHAVCLDPPLSLPAANSSAATATKPLRGNGAGSCLVYQFGVGEDWTFAEQLAERGCLVHVLDHRVIREPEGEHSRNVFFHRFGVGRTKYVSPEGTPVLTLDDVLHTLGHANRSRLDYLRADLSGLEGDMLFDQLVDAKSRRAGRALVLTKTIQLSLRLHLRPQVEHQLPWYKLMATAMHQLNNAGYDVVHSAPLGAGAFWKFPGIHEPIVLQNDVLLVRMREPSSTFSTHMVK